MPNWFVVDIVCIARAMTIELADTAGMRQVVGRHAKPLADRLWGNRLIVVHPRACDATTLFSGAAWVQGSSKSALSAPSVDGRNLIRPGKSDLHIHIRRKRFEETATSFFH